MFLNFNAKDGVIVVFLWLFWLFISTNAIFIIENFSYFTTGILVWEGAILAIVWYIFSILWGFLMLKTRTKTTVYIDGNEDDSLLDNKDGNETEKNNMKLPF